MLRQCNTLVVVSPHSMFGLHYVEDSRIGPA